MNDCDARELIPSKLMLYSGESLGESGYMDPLIDPIAHEGGTPFGLGRHYSGRLLEFPPCPSGGLHDRTLEPAAGDSGRWFRRRPEAGSHRAGGDSRPYEPTRYMIRGTQSTNDFLKLRASKADKPAVAKSISRPLACRSQLSCWRTTCKKTLQ
jgi:hypothetical protein